MRIPAAPAFLLVLASLSVVATGCSHKPPSVKTPAGSTSPVASTSTKTTTIAGHADSEDDDWTADERPKFDLRPRAANDTVPRVIRRIVAEQKEEVQHLLELAGDLPDARGRARATNEATVLAQELKQISAPMDQADSTGLDQIITKLVLLDTRIGILHDALRNATSRGTASVVE